MTTVSPGFTSRPKSRVEVGQVFVVAETQSFDFDLALVAADTGGDQGIRFGRGVHDVAQALDRHACLLELLPQPHQAQHGLGQFAGEHLERHQHADGEVDAAHHDVGTDHQDQQGHHLFQGVGRDVVSVADLLHAEAGVQVVGKVVAVAAFQLRFHLQALDRFQAGDVFGDKSLVARAQQELLAHPRLEQRRHHQAHADDGAQYGQGDQRQHHAVVEHDGDENDQERQVEDQRDGGARHEFADAFHTMQTG